MVSSAYCRIERPSSTRCGTTPLTLLLDLALRIRVAQMSSTKLNKIGDKGSPCLTPFLVSKKFPTSSFTLMFTLPPLMIWSIQLHHIGGKPFILKVCWRKDHLTLSKAFSQSSFKITPSNLFLCILWMVSCRITTPSKIFLSFMKDDWEGWIYFLATRAIRLVNALVKILKLMLSKQMGRYYWICVTSFSFGSNRIVPKLRLYRGRLALWKSSKRGRRSPFINSQKLDRTQLGTHQV